MILSWILLSYLCLTLSLVLTNGGVYTPLAFFVSAGSLIFLILTWIASHKKPEPFKEEGPQVLLGLGYGIFFTQLLYFIGASAVFQGWREEKQTLYMFQGVAILSTLAFMLWGNKAKSRRLLFGVILAVWTLSSVWILEKLPTPTIDVWVFSQKAAQSLLGGENPYSKIYDVVADNPYTPVTNRYVYPPFPLFLSTLAYLFTHEVRYANLACQLASALLLYALVRKVREEEKLPELVTLLFLFNPRWHYVLQQSWVEPLILPWLLVSLLFFLRKKESFFALFSGLFFSAKQYLLPLVLIYPRFFSMKLRGLLIAFSSFLALCLPFLILSPKDFYRNVVAYHFSSPVRTESLSLLSFTHRSFNLSLPSWLPFVAMLLVFYLGRKGKTLFHFTLTASLAFFLFFWLNKQAFLNYYFFIQSLMVLTLALAPNRSGKLSEKE